MKLLEGWRKQNSAQRGFPWMVKCRGDAFFSMRLAIWCLLVALVTLANAELQPATRVRNLIFLKRSSCTSRIQCTYPNGIFVYRLQQKH
jgi:hypothetical protein